MQRETTYSGILGQIQRFFATLDNVNQVPHLEASRVRLGEALAKAQDLAKQQAAVTASKQDLSKQLRTAMRDAQTLALMLRKGLEQHFGSRSEKLAEFGLQPFRGRKPAGDPAVQKPSPTPGSPTPHAA
jgi:hypothetical protein